MFVERAHTGLLLTHIQMLAEDPSHRFPDKMTPEVF